MKNKKIILLTIAIIVILIILAGIVFFISKNKSQEVSKGNIESDNQLAMSADGVVLDAEGIVRLIKAKDIANNSKTSIGRIVTYTSETDINELLGRPGQYTAKATFEDTRLNQTNLTLDPLFFSETEINEPTGGTVEVFSCEKDMQKRKEYVKTITSSVSPFVEYSYSKKNVLLRLNKQLTPEQAKYYEELFYDIIK